MAVRYFSAARLLLVHGPTARGLLTPARTAPADLGSHVVEQSCRAIRGQEGVARLDQAELDQAPKAASALPAILVSQSLRPPQRTAKRSTWPVQLLGALPPRLPTLARQRLQPIQQPACVQYEPPSRGSVLRPFARCGSAGSTADTLAKSSAPGKPRGLGGAGCGDWDLAVLLGTRFAVVVVIRSARTTPRGRRRRSLRRPGPAVGRDAAGRWPDVLELA